MKKKSLYLGYIFILAFIIWTILIQVVDVQQVGLNNTNIGFATLNVWFHNLCGLHLNLYVLTDWLSIIPILICMIFGFCGLIQLIQRKNIFKVDYDLLCLGIYYAIIIFCFLLFEKIPINVRPILIEGKMEASYPSSTTLLVLSVMPTMIFQGNRRLKNRYVKMVVNSFAIIFMCFMVMSRLVSGVHWFTDIIGGILLSVGLFHIYCGIVSLKEK